jgi:hypothetical protein
MDRQYTPKEFITLFQTHDANQQVREMFRSEFKEVKGSPLPLWASPQPDVENKRARAVLSKS